MPDARRILLALVAAVFASVPTLAQDKDPKETDDVLKTQTPPAAKPADDAKPVAPEKPMEKPAAKEESKDAAPAPAAEESEGKRLLRQSADAIKAARAISYSAKAYSTGALESLTPKADGLVKMRRVTGGAPEAWLARITGRTTKKGGKAGDGESLDFDVSYLGNKRIEWADSKNQKIVEKPDRSAQSPIVQGAKGLRLDELFAANPYTRDLATATATILDRKPIGGVECEVIQTEFGERKNKTRWYLGVADHMPRRVDRVIEGAMASEVVVEATDMKVETSEEPSISAASLRIPVLPGWTEEREPLAPPPAANPPVNTNAESAAKLAATTDKVDPAASTMPTAVAPAAPAAPPPPRVAPDFELTSTKGDKVSLQALRDGGTPAIVLDFFGPWSLLAHDWHPRLDDLAKRFAERGAKVFALSVRAKSNDDSVNMTKDFTFTTLLNADKVAKDYAIHVYPSTVVINRSGEIVRMIPGGKDDVSDQVAAAIEEAITGQKAPPAGAAPKSAEKPADAPTTKSEVVPSKSEAEKESQLQAEKEKAGAESKANDSKKDQ